MAIRNQVITAALVAFTFSVSSSAFACGEDKDEKKDDSVSALCGEDKDKKDDESALCGEDKDNKKDDESVRVELCGDEKHEKKDDESALCGEDKDEKKDDSVTTQL